MLPAVLGRVTVTRRLLALPAVSSTLLKVTPEPMIARELTTVLVVPE